MTRLRIQLIGQVSVIAPDGAALTFETRKARALLAILAMAHGQRVPRDRLADLLWGRSETRQALASLSQSLYSLRKTMEPAAPGLVEGDAEALWLVPDLAVVDALEIEERASSTDPGDWARALDLYAGSFLGDLALDTEEGFRDWRVAERGRIEALVTEAGDRLMRLSERVPSPEAAVAAERLLEIDPYSEPAARLRIRAQASAGRTAAALTEAEAMRSRLAADLDVAPSDEFEALVAQVRRGALRPSAGEAATRARPRRWWVIVPTATLVLALLALVPILRPSGPEPGTMRLLVMPFEQGDGVEADLAGGFSDDLATELVRRARIDVLSRETGRLLSPNEARQAGATHLLAGRLRREADGYVLNAWLTDLATGAEIWARRFTGTRGKPQTFRETVLGGVAAEIRLALADPPGLPEPALPPGAYETYLAALSRLHSGTAEGNAAAIDALVGLVEAHPDTAELRGALATAYGRVAFGSDAHARAARLNWLEGYLRLKTLLARTESREPEVIAARARLALRRRDLEAAEALAREVLDAAPTHVPSLALLAETLALSGRSEQAVELANRAVALAPATPSEGYLALALAQFGAGRHEAALVAAEAAIGFAEEPDLQSLALVAAIHGLLGDRQAAREVLAALLDGSESRPYAAWRVGAMAFDNPRSATWHRPGLFDVMALFGYRDAAIREHLRDGLVAAGLAPPDSEDRLRPAVLLAGSGIGDLVFDATIEGRAAWSVLADWSQSRTEDGRLYQSTPLGPLPAASEGTSWIADDRLCDSWPWDDTELENCSVVSDLGDGSFAMHGETGSFRFRVADQD